MYLEKIGSFITDGVSVRCFDVVDDELEAQLQFLTRTKNGEYAEIEKSSLPYTRLKERTEIIEIYEEEYEYYMT